MSQSRISPFYQNLQGPPVRGFLHTPGNHSGDSMVLTHGAGANCESRLLIALATAFCDAGLAVLRCDLPFRQLHPHGPPPRGSADRDQEGLFHAVGAMKRHSGRVFLGGHSYGGRQASMLVSKDPGLVDGLLLLSYPLHPPKKPEQPRTDHFRHLRTPLMFVQGVRDGMGELEEMRQAMKLIPVKTEMISIEGAGHELVSARTVQDVAGRVVEAFLKFVAQ
jgi:predicted alpha/beta-hydrolase family hydrolase